MTAPVPKAMERDVSVPARAPHVMTIGHVTAWESPSDAASGLRSGRREWCPAAGRPQFVPRLPGVDAPCQPVLEKVGINR